MKLVNAEEVRQIFDYEVAQGATDLFDAFDSAIENATAVDAAPVVHGRWEPELMPTGVEYIGYEEMTVQALRCSECGIFIDVSEGHFSFCPYCGAKMDGGVNSD